MPLTSQNSLLILRPLPTPGRITALIEYRDSLLPFSRLLYTSCLLTAPSSSSAASNFREENITVIRSFTQSAHPPQPALYLLPWTQAWSAGEQVPPSSGPAAACPLLKKLLTDMLYTRPQEHVAVLGQPPDPAVGPSCFTGPLCLTTDALGAVLGFFPVRTHQLPRSR